MKHLTGNEILGIVFLIFMIMSIACALAIIFSSGKRRIKKVEKELEKLNKERKEKRNGTYNKVNFR